VVFTAAGTPATIPCPSVSTRSAPSRLRRAETWLWTGPAGHLAGGTLDVLSGLARYALARVRGRALR
jgi:hypothetical protein